MDITSTPSQLGGMMVPPGRPQEKARTCLPCRMSKTRCSKGMPCERCVRLDIICRPQSRGCGRPLKLHKRRSEILAEQMQMGMHTQQHADVFVGHAQQQTHAAINGYAHALQGNEVWAIAGEGGGFGGAGGVSGGGGPGCLPGYGGMMGGQAPTPVGLLTTQIVASQQQQLQQPISTQVDMRVAIEACMLGAHRLKVQGLLYKPRVLAVTKAWASESYRRGTDITHGLVAYLSELLGSGPVGAMCSLLEPNMSQAELDSLRQDVDGLDHSHTLPAFIEALDDGVSAFCGCTFHRDQYVHFASQTFATLYMTAEEMKDRFRDGALLPPMIWARAFSNQEHADFFRNIITYMFSLPLLNKEMSMMVHCLDRRGCRRMCLARVRFVVALEGGFSSLVLSLTPMPGELSHIECGDNSSMNANHMNNNHHHNNANNAPISHTHAHPGYEYLSGGEGVGVSGEYGAHSHTPSPLYQGVAQTHTHTHSGVHSSDSGSVSGSSAMSSSFASGVNGGQVGSSLLDKKKMDTLSPFEAAILDSLTSGHHQQKHQQQHPLAAAAAAHMVQQHHHQQQQQQQQATSSADMTPTIHHGPLIINSINHSNIIQTQAPPDRAPSMVFDTSINTGITHRTPDTIPLPPWMTHPSYTQQHTVPPQMSPHVLPSPNSGAVSPPFEPQDVSTSGSSIDQMSRSGGDSVTPIHGPALCGSSSASSTCTEAPTHTQVHATRSTTGSSGMMSSYGGNGEKAYNRPPMHTRAMHDWGDMDALVASQSDAHMYV